MNGKLIAMLYHKGAQLFTVSSGKMQLALFARKLASQAAGTEHMVPAIKYVFTIWIVIKCNDHMLENKIHSNINV